ncbi:hypothetical protein OIDMADRAFT_48709 [Oidiodendron maius Zn]|uniref:Uncharacterized protein n=1 Tax=Oidiodendron maius (strain Zn) TaxID=913774 RepID=A0A0C3E3D8_OIDMZ|nr:hypothetical protein OIDMADRAFT_48709 [Oidiodendron maius Zn]
MAESSRLPRRLTLEKSPEVPLLVPGIYLGGPVRSCGINILVSQDFSSAPQRATLGGLVCIENKFYGLTVAHAFYEVKGAEHTSDQDFEFAFYGPDQPASLLDEGDDSISGSQDSSHSLESAEIKGSDASLFFGPCNNRPDSESTGVPTQEFNDLIRFGSFFRSAPLGSPLDWALIRIDKPEAVQLANVPSSELLANRVLSADRCIYPHALGTGKKMRVLICLGSLDSAAEGIMSGASSFAKPPGCKIFQELWQVSRLDGEFVNGDCGTWVLDFDTGNLLGHIISGYSGSQLAYVVPAQQVFRDINDRVGREVDLPTPSKGYFPVKNQDHTMDMDYS